MKTILKNIILLPITFKESFMLAISTVFAKDPCKKCLVSPCCIDKCEERILLENFILKGDTLRSRKLIAYFILFYFTFYLPLVMLSLIVKYC